jgi:hypothetical protein
MGLVDEGLTFLVVSPKDSYSPLTNQETTWRLICFGANKTFIFQSCQIIVTSQFKDNHKLLSHYYINMSLMPLIL